MRKEDISSQSRTYMQKGQLLVNAISDPALLAAMQDIPRDDFVPEAFKGVAYIDDDLQLCKGRFMLEPLVFARLVELAEIKPTYNVLNIACGLGYATAVLSRLAKSVYAVEENHELVQSARKRLNERHIRNVEVVTAPLCSGNASHAPYNRIIICGGIKNIKDELLQQLANGGKLLAIEQTFHRADSNSGLGQYLVIERVGESYHYHREGNASVVLLSAFDTTKRFEF